jgi:hypothetical protein
MSGQISAISFRNSAISILIRFASERLDRASGLSSLKSFLRSNKTLELSELLDIARTCCRVVRTACRDFPNSVDFWNTTPCRILIYIASERCCSVVRTSSKFICKTLRGVRTPSKACPDCCTGTCWFVLVFVMDSSWISSRSLWTIKVWIHEDSDLKTNFPIKMLPLHKVFLFYPECSQ